MTKADRLKLAEWCEMEAKGMWAAYKDALAKKLEAIAAALRSPTVDDLCEQLQALHDCDGSFPTVVLCRDGAGYIQDDEERIIASWASEAGRNACDTIRELLRQCGVKAADTKNIATPYEVDEKGWFHKRESSATETRQEVPVQPEATRAISLPVSTMSGAEWNVLDSCGCRIAWCGYDENNASHEKSGPPIAREIVEALNNRQPPLTGTPRLSDWDWLGSDEVQSKWGPSIVACIDGDKIVTLYEAGTCNELFTTSEPTLAAAVAAARAWAELQNRRPTPQEDLEILGDARDAAIYAGWKPDDRSAEAMERICKLVDSLPNEYPQEAKP